MKTNTKNKIISILKKRFLATMILGIGLATNANAQMFCQAAFTYTLGSGGTIACTNTSTGTVPNTVYLWQWQGVSGWGYTYSQSPTITVNYNGTYNLSLSINDSANNCSSSVTNTIVITAGQPCQVSFTYTTSANGQVNFTNTSLGNTTYYWNFGDGTSSTQTSPSHTYSYNGTYYVYMWADTTGGSCGGYIADTIVITNGLTCNLNPAFTYTAGSAGNVSFTDASTGVNPNMTYSWFWYNSNYSLQGSAGNLSSPTINFPYNGTYYVSMTVGDSSQQCYKVVTDTIVITNSQPCQVSFTYTVGSGGLVSFSNTSVGNISYYWNFGDGTSSTQQSPVHTYAYNGSYYVYMYADTIGGYCGGYAVDSIAITNTATSPTCNAAFTFTYNANGQVDFTNTSTGNVVNPTYSWVFGDGNGSYLYSPSNTYVYNGSYGVTLYVMDSLGNIICSAYQVVTINNSPGGGTCNDSAYFYMYPDSSAASTWNVYLASAFSSSYPVNATWYWGDGTSSTGLYPSHTYASAGWYNICVLAYFACGDSSYFCQTDSLYRASSSMVTVNVINNATGIKNTGSDVNSVKAFPNPFTDNLTLNLNTVNNSAVTYSISDVYGNILMNEKVSVEKGENKITLNTSEFSSGMYFVNVIGSNGKKMHTIKIVK